MKRPLPAAALAGILTMWSLPAAAQTRYSCGQGTVRGVEAVTETVNRDTVKTRRDADGDITTFVAHSEQEHRRLVVVSVQLKDRLYVSQSPGDPHGTLDPMRLAADDLINVCVDGVQLILERSDGTDYRAPVVRQALLPMPGAPRGTR